ncbi:uncharacterized protein LOC117111000 [Anneissia japonica]|uniref:uncharacterized protein LOC117111000 n=1 Tax=Anneissia japonica TaxID=1529436 RepID=UPI0014254CB8|nr:uncharacterized protein LOC117111000 [Anneissia japonica]
MKTVSDSCFRILMKEKRLGKLDELGVVHEADLALVTQHVNKKHSRNFIPISSLGDLSSPERNSSQEEYLDLRSQKTFFASTSRAKESLGHRSISVYDSGIIHMSTGTRLVKSQRCASVQKRRQTPGGVLSAHIAFECVQQDP